MNIVQSILRGAVCLILVGVISGCDGNGGGAADPSTFWSKRPR